jgi:hypothetical protein
MTDAVVVTNTKLSVVEGVPDGADAVTVAAPAEDEIIDVCANPFESVVTELDVRIPRVALNVITLLA